MRLQYRGEEGTGLRQDRPAPVSNHRRPEQGEPRGRPGATRERQGQPHLHQSPLRAHRPSGAIQCDVAGCGRRRQEQLRAGAGADHVRRGDHSAASGHARRRAGQSRLYEHRLAGGWNRRLAQRDGRTDGRRQLPDADAVPHRDRPDQDAGRHQCQRKRYRRGEDRRSWHLHRRRLPQANLPGQGEPGAAVAADRAERRHLRCRRQRRQYRPRAQAGHDGAVQIVVDQRADVLRVPNQALRYVPSAPESADKALRSHPASSATGGAKRRSGYCATASRRRFRSLSASKTTPSPRS